jgi:hypothetical protein
VETQATQVPLGDICLLAGATAVMDKALAAMPALQQTDLGQILFKEAVVHHLARKYTSL